MSACVVASCGGSDQSKKAQHDDAGTDAPLRPPPPAPYPDARTSDTAVDSPLDSIPDGGSSETGPEPSVDGGFGLVCLEPPGPVTLSRDCMDYFAPGTYFDFATNVFHLDTGIFTPEDIVVRIATVESIGAVPHRFGDPEFSIDGNIISVQVPPSETMRYAYIEVFNIVDPDSGRLYRADNLTLTWRYENTDAGAGERTCSTFGPLTIVPVPFSDCMDLVGAATGYDAATDTLVFEAASPYAVQLNTTVYGMGGSTCFLSDGVETSPGRFEWDTSGCPGATSFEVGILSVTKGQAPPFVLRVDVTVPAGVDAGSNANHCSLADEALFTPLPVGSCDDALSFAGYDESTRTFSWALASGLRPTALSVATDAGAETMMGEPILENGAFVWDLSDVVPVGASQVDFHFTSAVDGCGLSFLSDLSLSYSPGDGGAWSAACSLGTQCHAACAERCFCE